MLAEIVRNAETILHIRLVSQIRKSQAGQLTKNSAENESPRFCGEKTKTGILFLSAYYFSSDNENPWFFSR